MQNTKRVAEVMTRSVACVPEGATLCEVAHVMKDNHIGDVLVCDDRGKLCGIVTDRDIVVRGIGNELDPHVATAGEIASSEELVSLRPEDSVDAAIAIMRERAVRRIPVLRDGRPVGIVSIGDLAQTGDPGSALGAISAASPNG